MEKDVKETLLSFSYLEIHCHEITEVKYGDERINFFGILFFHLNYPFSHIILLFKYIPFANDLKKKNPQDGCIAFPLGSRAPLVASSSSES